MRVDEGRRLFTEILLSGLATSVDKIHVTVKAQHTIVHCNWKAKLK